MKIDHGRMTTFIHIWKFQFCPRAIYNLEQDITDIGCRLTGLKCGENMIFVTMEQYFSENSDTIIGCVQSCRCKEGFIYYKKNGKCVKKVCIIFFHATIYGN